MNTKKLFTHAGISQLPTQKGAGYKLRFANDEMRVKVLVKGGHKDIRLVALDQPMTKLEAARFLQGLPEFGDTIAQATILEYIDINSSRTTSSRPGQNLDTSELVELVNLEGADF